MGRERELGFLERAYKGEGPAFVPVYGRRRVGKSELILRFLEGKRAIYYLGKQAPAPLQQREFLREAARALDEPLLASLTPESWSQVLRVVADRWPAGEKLVIVLDEFQWIVAASPELPSVLQELWDQQWRSLGAFVVLCGSFIGFMEREVLGHRSPLFGRRTGQILLKPFPHREAARFHPHWSLADKAQAYFICGGVPHYLQFFERQRSIEQNIESTLLDVLGPLAHEPDFLLREELREVESYHAVLMAIASGWATARSIADHTGLAERSVPYYIKQLGELGYVGRQQPLTGRGNQRVRYTLDDPLLRFWFRFVFPNRSFIEQVGPRRALRERIRPELDAYFGLCFERLCREALPSLYLREGVSASFEVGEYWDRAVQIDVVGLRDDNWTDLGECKWGTVRSWRKLAAELEAKVSLYPNARGATVGRRLFVRQRGSRTPPELPATTWHDLDDLYAEPE